MSTNPLRPEPPKAPMAARRPLNSAPSGEGDLDLSKAPQRPTTSDSANAAAEASIVSKVNPRHALALLLKESASYNAQWAQRADNAPAASSRAMPLGEVINGRGVNASATQDAAVVPSPPSSASSPVLPSAPKNGSSARVTSTLLRQLKTITTIDQLCLYETELRTLINGNQTRQWSHIYHSKLVLVCHIEEREQAELEHLLGAKRIAQEEALARQFGEAAIVMPIRPVAPYTRQQPTDYNTVVPISIPIQRLICQEIAARVSIYHECSTLPSIAKAYAMLMSTQLLGDFEANNMLWLKRFEALERHEMETRFQALKFGHEQLETDRNRASAWLIATKHTEEFKGSERSLFERTEWEARSVIEEKERKFFSVYVAEAYQQRRWVLSTDVPTWETTKRARLELDEEQLYGIFMTQHRKGVKTAHFASQQNAFISREDIMRSHMRTEEAARIQHILTWADRRWYELYQMRLMADEANAPLRFLEHDEVCKRRDIEQDFRNQCEVLEIVEFDRRRDVKYLDQQRQACFEEYVDGRLILQHMEQQQWKALAKEAHLDQLYIRSLDLRRDLVIDESYNRAKLQNTTDDGAKGLKHLLSLLNTQAEEDSERSIISKQALSKLTLIVSRALDAPLILLNKLGMDEASYRESLITAESSEWHIFVAHAKAIIDGGSFNLEIKLLRQAETLARHGILVAEAQQRLENIEMVECIDDETARRLTRINQEVSVRSFEGQELVKDMERVNRKERLEIQWREGVYSLAKQEHICGLEEIQRAEYVANHEEEERKYLRILFNRVNPLFKYESLLWATEEAECDRRMAIESQGELVAATILRTALQDLFPWTLGGVYYLKQLLTTRPVSYVTIRSVAEEASESTSPTADKSRSMAEAYSKQSITGESIGPSPRKPVCITWGAFMLEQLLVENRREADFRSLLEGSESINRRYINIIRHEDLQRTALYELQDELWGLSMAACRRVMHRDQNREAEVYAGVFQMAEDDTRTQLWIQERQNMLQFLSTRNSEEQAIADRLQEELRLRILVWQGPLLNDMYEDRRTIAQLEFDSIQNLVTEFRRGVVTLHYKSGEQRLHAVTARTIPYLQEADVATLVPTLEYYGVPTSPKISDKYQLKLSTLRAERHGAALETSAQLIDDDLALREIIEAAENEEYSQLYAACAFGMPWQSHRDVEKAHLSRVKMELLLMIAQANEREVVAGQFVRGEPATAVTNIKRLALTTPAKGSEESVNSPDTSAMAIGSPQLVPEPQRLLIRDLFKARDELSIDESNECNAMVKAFLRRKDVIRANDANVKEVSSVAASSAASLYLRCGNIISDDVTLQAIAKACEIIASAEKRADTPSHNKGAYTTDNGGQEPEDEVGSESDDEDLQVEFALRIRVASHRGIVPLPPPTLMYLAADGEGVTLADGKKEILLVPEYIANVATVLAATSASLPNILTDPTALLALYERHLKAMRGDDSGYLDVCWAAPIHGNGDAAAAVSTSDPHLQIDASLVAVMRTASQGIQSIIDVMSGAVSVDVIGELLKRRASEDSTSEADKRQSLASLWTVPIPMTVHDSIEEVMKANTADGDLSHMRSTVQLWADRFLRDEEDLHATAWPTNANATNIAAAANKSVADEVMVAIAKAGEAEAEAVEAEQQQRRAISLSHDRSQRPDILDDREVAPVPEGPIRVTCRATGASLLSYDIGTPVTCLSLRIHQPGEGENEEAITTVHLALEGDQWVAKHGGSSDWSQTLDLPLPNDQAKTIIVAELLSREDRFEYLTELTNQSECSYLGLLLTSVEKNETTVAVAEIALNDWAASSGISSKVSSTTAEAPLWSEVTNQKVGVLKLSFTRHQEAEL